MKKRILLHSCCAPCLTSVYEQLESTYDVVVFWYNPNIWPKAEHDKRLKELIRYCQETGINLLVGDYDYQEEHQHWLSLVKGLEKEPEKGARCEVCYRMRLRATAETALEINSQHNADHFDFLATELSVSPHKDAELLNKIGSGIVRSLRFGRDDNNIDIKYLPGDYKKNGGFKRSTELSKEHNLYRQNYCGCEFSLKMRKPLTKVPQGGPLGSNLTKVQK